MQQKNNIPTEKDSKHYRLEKDLVKAIRARLEGLGALVIKIHGERYQEAAVDLLICYRGRFIACEAKVGSNVATQHQEVFLNRIRNAGGIGITAWTVADCLVPLQMIDKELGASNGL